jgi:hypothetical protein
MGYMKSATQVARTIASQETLRTYSTLETIIRRLEKEYLHPGSILCVEVEVDCDGVIQRSFGGDEHKATVRQFHVEPADIRDVYQKRVMEVAGQVIITHRSYLPANKQWKAQWPFKDVPTLITSWNRNGYQAMFHCFEELSPQRIQIEEIIVAKNRTLKP